jgi:23S rRNA (guanosine2251-2'-O)-methyltransferase
VKVRPAEDIARRCGSETHQGVCASVGGYPYVGADELLAVDSPLIVVLDQVQDPQNLGSICRTAECVGATGVVIPVRRSVEVTPAVCKASAGAVEHIRVARVRNIADFLAEASRAGCWSYGASAPSKSTVAYTDPDYSGGVVLVLGSEGSGLRPRVAASCDQLVYLPMRGRIESLGVAAAAAALLYGILQAREAELDKAP